ncbi:MAG: hypothetical protein JJE50_13855 [Actinomycetales bacterium]|nr:hypothetical protein [Actinomycetales bacterium]
MTDFDAENYYSRHDGTEATDAPPERDLTTVRGAAAWGLEQARVQREWDESRRHPVEPLDLAQTTFRRAALDCAGIAAAMVLDGGAAHSLTWALAYRLLLDRADAARVSRAGGAT